MCPVCLSTALLIAGGATSTGGLAAIVLKRLGVKDAEGNNPNPIQAVGEVNGARDFIELKIKGESTW
jgi:hypothetical protein